jgi:hypothetical protein
LAADYPNDWRDRRERIERREIGVNEVRDRANLEIRRRAERSSLDYRGCGGAIRLRIVGVAIVRRAGSSNEYCTAGGCVGDRHRVCQGGEFTFPSNVIATGNPRISAVKKPSADVRTVIVWKELPDCPLAPVVSPGGA